MTVFPDLSLFSHDALEALFDEGALHRGRAYALEGRVELTSVTQQALEASCRGSGSRRYRVRVDWQVRSGGIALDDSCTCPLGSACKHCVATILTAKAGALGAAGLVSDGLGSRHPRPVDDWRRALADLPVGESPDEPELTPLALQVSLTWPSSTRYGADSGGVVSIRPLRRGKKGSWVKTGASWNDIDTPYLGTNLRDVDPAQRSALRALHAASRTSYYSTAQTVELARFGPDLWPLLARAVDTGVVLVGPTPRAAVEVSEVPAMAGIDLTAVPGGGVRVWGQVGLGADELELDGDGSGLIGSPPHGVWLIDGDVLRLAPFPEPLHPAVARLVTSNGLVVPPHDVDELLDRYEPALSRLAKVGSSNGSVTIEASRFEGLALVVERPAIDVAQLHWAAVYRRGDRRTRYPLRAAVRGRRDAAAEQAALEALELPVALLPAIVDPDGGPADGRVSGRDAVTFATEVVPWLEARGQVAVEVIGDLPSLRLAEQEPRIALAVADGTGEQTGNDWFELDVEVSVDGETVDFVPLFTALDRGDEVLVLPSGTCLSLDRPELARLRDLIAEARGLADPTPSGAVRLSSFQTGWWEELASLGVVEQQSARWAANVARMGALSAPERVPPPAGLEATLRPYQQDGFDWLMFLYRNQLGGILADDMGLGKTVQTLALALHVAAEKPGARTLVVAPTSVMENWAREAARFAPSLTVCTIRETQARRGTPLADAVAGADLVITSHALFRLEFEGYDALSWELLLVDEAQFVKNHQGKTYQCVRRLDVATKIALTGTPLENSLMDLWSLLSIAAPGLYPDPKRFSATFRKPIENGSAPELLGVLRRRIAPLMRRRTKDEVLTELPPKTEQTVEVELSPRHARIYQRQLQRQRQKVLGLVGDVQKHRFEILKSLTVLRQLALDPALVDEAHEGVGSAKLDHLLDDLTQVVAEGHRALVFSQFTRYLARVRARLDDAGIAHSYLDGRTRKRDEAIARFKDGEVPVFVISLKAGGVGLNLTEADYCFILDPWWNPAAETQAIDRAHRMGQQHPVMAYRYVSAGTIEEKVMELKARKADLFDRVIDGEGALAGALTEDDIRGLLDLG